MFGKFVGNCTIALLLVSTSASVNAQTAPSPKWAHENSDLAADPTVRFGTLPNGLRYAIQRNHTPKNAVAMRMRIGSGSIQEQDDEQGLAHFLEHMAFRGSTNLADGDVIRMLERHGLSFGADTNAQTSPDQTVYIFNFPRADAGALDTGFILFREIADRLTLAPALVEAEKGVLLSDTRGMDTPAFRASTTKLNNLMAGARLAQRWVKGQDDAIRAATPARLRRYYNANYRPDNATIVVVGAVDVDAVEKEIRQRFSDWTAKGVAEPIAIGTPVPAAPTAEYVGAGAPDQLVLSWVRPLVTGPDTRARARERLLRAVGLSVLGGRLAQRSLNQGAPFAQAIPLAVDRLFQTAALTELQVTASSDKWTAALEAATDELRALLAGGVQKDELARAVTTLRTQRAAEVAGEATIASAERANALVYVAGTDSIYTSSAQDLANDGPILDAVTPEQVTEVLRATFAGKGPVLFRSAPSGAVGPDALAQASAKAFARPIVQNAQQQVLDWPYSDFGTPSAIVERTEDKALGTTMVRFANGTRLVVKPTAFEKDRVHVAVNLGNGRAGMPPALAHAAWTAEVSVAGGTGKLSLPQIGQWAQTHGKAMFVNISMTPRALILTGRTRPVDLVTQMQLLTAYARDPGFRPEAGQRVTTTAPMLRAQFEGTAAGVFNLQLQNRLNADDLRFADPVPEAIVKTTAQEMEALVRPALAGPADVVIVGDVTVDAAIASVRATLGAGPTQPARVDPKFPAPPSVAAAAPGRFTHLGRADQAISGLAWRMPDYFADPHGADAAEVAAAMLTGKLTEIVRAKLGIAYTPQAVYAASASLPRPGFFLAALETPEANFGVFRAVVREEIAKAAKGEIDPDAFERAKRPLVAAHAAELENNAFWIGNLSAMMREPRVRQQMLDRVSGVSAVTPQDVQAMLRRYLAGQEPQEIDVVAVSK